MNSLSRVYKLASGEANTGIDGMSVLDLSDSVDDEEDDEVGVEDGTARAPALEDSDDIDKDGDDIETDDEEPLLGTIAADASAMILSASGARRYITV